MPHARSKTLANGEVRWYAAYRGADGCVHEQGGFASKRKAESEAHRLQLEAERGVFAAPLDARMSFANFVESHYRPAISGLEVTTQAGYDSVLRTHFLPRFGHLPMKGITPPMVQAWINEMGAEDGGARRLSARSVVKFHAVLHAVFALAVEQRVVTYNPCSASRLPKVVKKPKQIITPEQFDAIVEQIPSDHVMLVLLAIETGMRWGELTALRRCDIDTQNNLVLVRRATVEVAKRLSPSGEARFIKPYPKSGEQRDIQIEPATIQMLREHCLAFGIAPDNLLFTTRTGTILSRSTFRARVWIPAIEAAGLSCRVRFHDLRAAHISWLLAGGADVVTTMLRAGHKHLATTQEYVGTLPDSGDRALAALRKVRGR